MFDYSFLRLVPDFAQSKDRPISKIASIIYTNFIQLLPTETYLQITNTLNGIAFDQNYQVSIVDCQNNEILDITNKVSIQEFTDERGLPQIAFEIAPIGQDYHYYPIQLRFRHTVSNAVWWSNEFVLTSYRANLISRFEYKSFAPWKGTSNRLDYFQRIRLNCWFLRDDDQIEVGEYFQISTDRTISDKPRMKTFEKYMIEFTDNFTLRRFKRMLLNDVVYMNGVRCSNKPIIKDTDPIGTTNLQRCEFSVSLDYNDSKEVGFQITSPFEIIERYPLQNGVYGIINIQNLIILTFNRPYTLGNGELRVYRDNVLIATRTQSDVTQTSSLIATLNASLKPLGTYRIEIDPNLFVDAFGQTISEDDWMFTLRVGDFSNNDFNGADYFIN